MQTDLTSPIIGIENRTAQEVFDIMCDRIRSRLTAAGWRLVGPDEVDPVTVERCIAIVEAKAPKDTGEWCPYRAWAVGSIPYLRAIASGGKP